MSGNTLTAFLLAGLVLTAFVARAAEPAPAAEPRPLAVAAERLAAELARGEHPGITSFWLSVAGERLAGWSAPELERQPPDLRSATKSITALLVGIAIDRGELPGVDAKVIDLLPELRSELAKDPRKAAMTLADLLTMRSGLDCDDWDPKSPGHEDRMYRQRDWLAFWAKQALRAAPGERYSYCTGNAVALGRILAHATGMGADAYAEAVLLAPLGVTGARWARWYGGKDVDTGGHLRLSPQGLLKIGEMLLAGGRGQGRQIVSAAWLAQMTREWTAVPERPQRYGFLWWLDSTRSAGLPASRLQLAWGNGGNFLVVLPELETVAVFTGTRFNRPNALEPLFWLRDRLLSAWGEPAPVPHH